MTGVAGRWASRVFGAMLVLPAVLIVGILFVYPFFRSLTSSFQTEMGWGLQNYRQIWELYRFDILYTIWIGVASLAVLLAFGILLGGFLRLRADYAIEFLFKIPLFIPFVVVGHAMRVFLAPNGTLNALLSWFGVVDLDHPPSLAYSSAGMIIALVWKNLSMALLLMMGAFRGVDNSYIEAARNVGANALRIIFNILVPMAKGAIVVSAVLIFTSIIGNFSIPAMMGSAKGSQVLMIDLYYEIVYQHNYGVANAIGVVAYLISMGAAVYYLRMVTKR